MKLKNILFPILLLSYSMVNAESFVYVTDMVPIPMRSENKIQNSPSNLIKMLDSGTKLEILATEDGWTKVKFEQTIGWIISRYLTSNEPARVQLEALKRSNNNNQLSLSKKNDRNKELEKQVADLKAKNAELSIQSGKLESEKEHVKQVYKDALKLEYKNKNLKKQTLQLKAELKLLQNNNTVGQEASARNWFIVGALVLFFGFMTGFIFQKRTNQRRF
ncbi:MAG: TIGR04211 family SH3 domain-containing protein [Gammaproteobacteria bacterium]|nr:TIGR04211 family SH3 domain-containing protein [Gammaproteobacteria bacterium]